MKPLSFPQIVCMTEQGVPTNCGIVIAADALSYFVSIQEIS